MAKKSGNVIGGWAFLVGVVLALIIGITGYLNQTMSIILVIAGLVIGLLNITDEESSPFLMSGAVLIIASALGQNALQVIPVVAATLRAILMLFVPAIVIVSVRHVFSLARK